jgi:hypothetical protein
MQTVGIVEDTAAIRERDKAEEDSFAQETDIGLQRLETGKFLCVAGVWGVCGLRRRILVGDIELWFTGSCFLLSLYS